MDPELYDCRHCGASGVLPTSGSQCPNCKHTLGAQDKQGSLRPNRAPLRTSPNKEEERRQKKRKLVTAVRAILPGVLVLLASPVTYVDFIAKHGEWTGTIWEFSGSVAPSVVDEAAGWAVSLLLVGWILSECGLLIARVRPLLQVLLRIPLYGFIVATLAMIAFGFVMSRMGP